MREQAPSNVEENYQDYISRLVEAVRSSGMQGMTSQEADDLDEAIELGFVDQNDLRAGEHAAEDEARSAHNRRVLGMSEEGSFRPLHFGETTLQVNRGGIHIIDTQENK